MDATANGGDQLRMAVEEPQARFHLEHGALAVDARHRSELARPGREPLEGRALGYRVALDNAQVHRERTRRSHTLPVANARVPRRLVAARHDLALRGTFGDYERLTGDACALDDLERECGELESDP